MASQFPRLLLLLLLLLPYSVFARTNVNVTVGTSLSAIENSSPWLSASGDFAFGFHQLENQKDLFLLSIWYAKIPDRTIVWYANGDSPPVPRGSKVDLTADKGLVLTSPQGQELWKSELVRGNVSHGVMSDEGNFIIEDASSEKLWETFKNPTDTMLPTQTMERGGLLSSHQTETNFSKGRFQLRLQQDGNLVLNTINLPTDFPNNPYYASGTDEGSNQLSAGTRLVFNETGNLYVLRANNERLSLVSVVSVSARDNYLRATLNFDGVFILYYHPKSSSGNQKWTVIWSIPENICQRMLVPAGIGVCGHNSICILKEDSRPTCQCIKRYSLIDPNDTYGSCKPDFIQGCAEDELTPKEDLYEVVEMINADWPLSDYVELKPFNGDACKESCMKDCLCAVAIFRDGTCWKKRLPVSNGRFDGSLNSRAFIKVRKDNFSLTS